jgi:glycosyltransferase involved in cell wall biosynthesis
MRVLHVVEATIAGVRAHVQVLAAGLDRHRFHSVVACPLRRENAYGDDQFVTYLTNAGIPVVPVAMRRAISPLADLAALRRLVGILRRQHFDIIHLHSSKAGFLGRLAARVASPRSAVVYSPNGLSFLGDQHPAKRRLYLALEQLAGRLGDCIIAVSPGEREILLRSGVAAPDRVVVIENGIPPARLPAGYDRAAMRCALGQSGGDMLIGTVARLSAQKNPNLFVDAAAQVLRNQPGARFVWCGGGELAEPAQRRANELGIAGACRFLGHRDDAHQVIGALDLFWLTSDYEGMPMAPMEAMSLRVPVIATDVVGTRDLLCGGAGLLVPRGDAPALAAATLALIGAPERRDQLARAGYAHFLERGTADRMISAIERLYQDLAASRGQSGAPAAHEVLP